MNYYIVIFNRNSSISYSKFQKEFVSNRNIKKYWHYIRSAYIVGTPWDEEELSDHFMKTAKTYGIPNTHLVLEVDLDFCQGMLTEDAWEWLRKNSSG